MRKDIQIFNNDKFGAVRTVTLQDEPWFVAADVARILGYTNPNEAVSDHVDSDDKFLRGERGSEMLKLFSSVKEMQKELGRQDNWFINESGVYSLVFGSKLESAKEFKHWVTHDVLPSIRKTGAYQIPKVTPNPHYRTRMVKTAVTDIGGTAQAIMLTYHVKPGMALAAAQEMVGKAYGIDTTPLQRLIPAEEHPGYLNASMIAERLGLKYKTGKPNAVEANKRLEAAGLMEKHGKHWRLTEAGKLCGEEKPYTNHGHSDYQIVWNDGVFDALGKQ